MSTRPTPGSTAPAMRTMVPAARSAAPYDRQEWEAALLASDAAQNAKCVGLTLAHHAGARGVIDGGRQRADALAAQTSLAPKYVRISLNALERHGWIRRPSIHDWPSGEVRPVTLTVPAAARRVPPRGGGHP